MSNQLLRFDGSQWAECRWIDEGGGWHHYVDSHGKIIASLQKEACSSKTHWKMDTYISLDSAKAAVERHFNSGATP